MNEESDGNGKDTAKPDADGGDGNNADKDPTPAGDTDASTNKPAPLSLKKRASGKGKALQQAEQKQKPKKVVVLGAGKVVVSPSTRISLSHFLYFLAVPCLVYEPRYPRTKSIRWSYVWRKLVEVRYRCRPLLPVAFYVSVF